MSEVHVDQASYEMPPREGFSVTHFLTVADIERSSRWYEKVFGGRILSRGDSKGASGHIQIANTWLIVNVGGGPTPDKPTVTLSVLADPDKINSFMNIRVADIQEAADLIRVGGDAERYRRLVRSGPTPDVDNQPRIRDLNVPGRTLAVASTQNTAAEDLFIKISRSVDVGDGDKMSDRKSLPRRHLIAFLFDFHFVHKRLRFR